MDAAVKHNQTKIPGPPLFKFITMSRQHPIYMFYDLMHRYGGIVNCKPFFYLINDADLARKILNKDQKIFRQFDFISKRTRRVFGKGLVINESGTWSNQRRLVNPAFSFKKVHEFVDIINNEIDIELERWNTYSESGEVFDLGKEMERMTLAITGKILFNEDMRAHEAPIRNIVHISTKYLANSKPYYLPFWIPTKEHRALKNYQKITYKILEPILDKRLQDDHDYDDFLQLLVNRMKQEPENVELRAHYLDEMKTMLAAGFFPTACAISFFWYTMSQNPNYLNSISQEIRTSGSRLDMKGQFYKDLPKTTQSILEAMRLYPVAFSIWRKCQKDIEINGYVIPKGKTIAISMYSIHRNPELWKDPDKFWPERFNEENSKNRPPHYFIPFGWGSRKCLGDHMAMMIIYLIIIRCISSFNINVIPNPQSKILPLAMLKLDTLEARVSKV